MATFSVAQTSREETELLEEADRYYNEEQYNLAIQYYQQLLILSDQNAVVNYQLAESYRKTFNYNEAEVYYLKVYYQAPVEYNLALYYYALMLKLNGSFTQSLTFFNEFIALHEKDALMKEIVEQAIVDKAGSEMALAQEGKKSSSYLLRRETVNSTFNDYAPSLADSTTLVITSGRVESNRQVIDERYGEGFTDNFYFVKTNNVWQDKTRQVFNVTNSRFNDGSGNFNSRGDKYYFTVCGKDGPQCHIYVSELKNAKWSAPVALNDNINGKNIESKHPAVSHGGDTLLFSSNRKGGYGNFDIWMSINAGNDNWGPPINMGSSVNTKLNELSPAFTQYPNVFFMASDGHQNYGGLDLYLAKRLSTGVTALYNLDDPFNSNRDDCFLSVTENKIYFSSNREGGAGGFDIYAVPVPSVISFVSKISLKKKGARSDVKLNVRAENISTLDLVTARNEDRIEYENLTYEKKKMVDKMIANQFHHTESDRNQFPDLSAKEFNTLKHIADTQYKTRLLEQRFKETLLSQINATHPSSKEMVLNGTLKDSISGNTLPAHKILLMNDLGEVLKVTTTNTKGKFRFTDVPSGNTLYLRLENGPQDRSIKAVVKDLLITAYENEKVSFENIYFDFDHYRLRPEAEQALKELAAFIKRSPLVQVEIYAYADDLGADDYNLALTQRRGEAVLNFLAKNGVDQTALAVIAKGRQKNDLTEIAIQRQYNRRVEFYINGTDGSTPQTTNTYILRKKSTWEMVAASTGIAVAELRRINGSTVNELQLFQPLRIPKTAKTISPEMFFTIR